MTKAEDEKARKRNQLISIGALVLSFATFFYTAGINYFSGRSSDKRLGNIETSLRVLTQTVAPQLYNSINDSLRSAVAVPNADATRMLKDVQADIGQLQSSKVPPQTDRLLQSGISLADVTIAHPGIIEAWAASAQLISYRSSGTDNKSSLNLGYCVSRPWTALTPPITPGYPIDETAVLETPIFHDCTLVIDDERAFEGSPAYLNYSSARQMYPNTLLGITLYHVHVIYRGGQPIKADRILFRECTFEFQPPSAIPPDTGKRMVRELLAADVTKDIKVALTPGI